MRLLDTQTGQFVEGVDPKAQRHPSEWSPPPKWVYAILSHTWDKDGEQTYEELKKIQQRYAAPREPQASQGRPGGPENVPSSLPEQDRGGPSLTPPPSQLPHDSPSVTPLLTPSTPPKSWFARKTARLRMWCRRRSACNAPDPPASTGTSPPTPITSSRTAFGCLTQSEVDALLLAFGEVYGLASSAPVPAASSDPSPPSQEHQATKPQSIWDDTELSPKIRDACKVARENGYRYIWIDSCCIDKSSSSELSEAINSMYKWYRLAGVCYAYLADVPPGDDYHAEGSCFRKSRWFTRGWTLQELIAPDRVEFLSQDWAPIGSKHDLVNLVENVTSISGEALLHVRLLEEFSIAQRLSWAAKRNTTRVEDRAYSLLGIFDINMPTLYGEGKRAFRRLQEQIMQRIPDQSLFAWGDPGRGVYLPWPGPQLPLNPVSPPKPKTFHAFYRWEESPLAGSPNTFTDSGNIRHLPLDACPNHHEIECTFTPYGIRAQFEMIPLTSDLLSAIFLCSKVELILPGILWQPEWYLAILSGCEHNERQGHRLGRVYCTWPSKSSFNYVHPGYLRFSSTEERTSYLHLIALPPEIVEQFRPRIKLKTVYMSHPRSDHTDSHLSKSLQREQRYTAIKLFLLTETRNALRSRGYEAELRCPYPAPTAIHLLTLSKDEHKITVEFQHALHDHGTGFTIAAEVKMAGSGSGVQLEDALDSDQADRRIMGWRDYRPWKTGPHHRTVELTSAGAGARLTVDLSIDFAGAGVYFVGVNVRSNAPPVPRDVESTLPVSGSAVESAGDEGMGVGLNGGDSRSSAINTEDSKAGQEVEVGGREMVLGEVRDPEAASEEAGDGDRGST